MTNDKSYRFFITTIIFFSFLTPVIVNGESPKSQIKESLYAQLNRNVIRLEHFEQYVYEGSNDVLNRNVPNGTAFFVATDNALFVVTARHVADVPYDLHARVQTKNRLTGNIDTILLKIQRNRWIYHPSSGDNTTNPVDVAVTKINTINDRDIINFKYNKADNKESNLPPEDPEPPQSILVFGFPGDLGFELKEQRPIGRLGIIMMVSGEKTLKYNNKYADSRTFLIDSSLFPGNSGSPVIKQIFPIISGKVELLGIVSASNVAMKFAVVYPVSRIRETIDIAINQSLTGVKNWFPLE